MKQTKKIEMTPQFLIRTLRNVGYTNYTAIADIIDNSVENDVGSTYVAVKFDVEKSTPSSTPKTSTIMIVDDGCGMDMETLQEAMKLGSETGKVPEMNLGMYGCGMKTAALAIGQVLEVFSKQKDEDVVNYARFSIEDAIKDPLHGDLLYEYDSFGPNTPQYDFWKGSVTEPGKTKVPASGTIVKLSHLDYLSTNSHQNFVGTLTATVKECFNKFIGAKSHRFYVNDKIVPYVDLMASPLGSSLMDSVEITFHDANGVEHKATVKGYYLPIFSEDATGQVGSRFVKDSQGNEYLRRNTSNQGLFIYRQYRLVGKGLTFGIFARDTGYSGFRCEVFTDGFADANLGSTFTKMVGEKDRGDMNQEFFDALSKHVKNWVNEAKSRQRSEKRDENIPQEVKIAQEKFYADVTASLNGNILIAPKLRKKAEKDPNSTPRQPVKNPGRPGHPGPHQGHGKWIGEILEVNLGRGEPMWEFETNNGLKTIKINRDHKFYEKIYSPLSEELKREVVKFMACEALSLSRLDYSDDSPEYRVIRDFIDEYAAQVKKVLQP